jgi:hypothetical protein
MGTRRQEYVVFWSPGTLFAESTSKPIERRDIGMAVRMAKDVVERHAARPYGFHFETRIVSDPIPDGEGGTMDVPPKPVDASGIHFLNGKLRRYDEVVALDDPRECILRSNMKYNDPIVCETRNSWLSTMPFREKDIVLDADGSIVERGDDPAHVAYRAEVKARVGE